MRRSASNTPISTGHGAHDSTHSAPASFSFEANGVKSAAPPGTTTTGIVSSPSSRESFSANSISACEIGMPMATKPTFTFLPPASLLIQGTAKRLSHWAPNDVEQNTSALAGGNDSFGHTPPPKSTGILAASASVRIDLYVGEIEATTMATTPSENFFAAAAARE